MDCTKQDHTDASNFVGVARLLHRLRKKTYGDKLGGQGPAVWGSLARKDLCLQFMARKQPEGPHHETREACFLKAQAASTLGK